MNALFKVRKRNAQQLFGFGYALLALYILLNTSFLQLSIQNYVHQQNKIASEVSVFRPVLSAEQVHILRRQKAVSEPVHAGMKIEELIYLSVVTLSNLSFVERVTFSEYSKFVHSIKPQDLTAKYHFSLYYIPSRRAPPLG